MRTQVLLARPDNFEDAVLVAERSDAAIMFARGLSGGYNSFNKKDKYHGSYRNKPAHTPMELGNVASSSDAAGKGGDRSRMKIVCYYCGRTGHIKKECYKYKNAKAKGKANVSHVNNVSAEAVPQNE